MTFSERLKAFSLRVREPVLRQALVLEPCAGALLRAPVIAHLEVKVAKEHLQWADELE